MKKYIICALIFLLGSTTLWAQSGSMTDNQVMQFIVKEHTKGTSNTQIVTKLMQNGVDINQIRRVRKKYQREQKESGLGNISNNTENTSDKLRVNNGKTREDYQKQVAKTNSSSSYRINDTHEILSTRKHSFDENDQDYLDMQKEMFEMIPDSTEMLQRLLAKEKAEKKKVFGRDIFNNNELTFESNMNIATPQNYRLGPGDAVIIEIYGVSQKTIQDTVSPDGTVTIEGFGPVNISGLTVSQANNRLRNTLGSRYRNSKIRLTVGQTKTIMINVMGEVKVPGTYTLSAFATVFHALYGWRN